MFQYLYECDKYPISLYFDQDAEIDIEKMLFDLREIYNVDKIYVLKSTYTQSNKYHIYLPQIVYNNINEMKFDL